MTRGRCLVAHRVVMVVAALVAAPVHAGLITFTFTGQAPSVGSQVSSAFPVGAHTLDSPPTLTSSMQGHDNEAITSINVAASDGHMASDTELQIAINNDDLHDHDRYRAVVGESPHLLDKNAPANGLSFGSSTIAIFDRTDTALAHTTFPARPDPSHFDATDVKNAMQVAFDFGSSPNIEASLVTARLLSPEHEIVSGFEPPRILVFLVGVIGSGLAGLALTRRALTKRKRTRWPDNYMTVQAGKGRRVRHGGRVRHHFMHVHSRTWLTVFLPLLAFVYFLLFGLSKVVSWLVM